MKIENWLKNNTADLQGRVVVLTGAAGGLGSKLSQYLIRLNAKLIMIDRDVNRMNALREELLKTDPNATIETIALDLNRIRDVHDVALSLVNRRIDYLMLNAGVYKVPLSKSELGYNNVFQINFISQYYLVKMLMPALARTKGKVVATGSIAYAYTKLDENDLDFTNHKKATHVYGNSKRCLIFALSELFKHQTDVRLALVHPGVTPTPMTTSAPKVISWLIKGSMKMMFPKPDVAALNILWGVFKDIQPDQWIGPKKAGIWGAPTVDYIKEGTPEERTRVFEIAENIYRVIEKLDL